MARLPLEWTLQDTAELYAIEKWGKGYFSINDRGHVAVHPDKTQGRAVDLKTLVDRLLASGLELPLLLRFKDVLRHSVREMNRAFEKAIEENDYRGAYCGVYPIKVNQQRQVVEDLVDCSRDYRFGLECGSKPELLAVLALTSQTEIPILCNGFKDGDFIEMVLLAQKIGKNVLPVVEKFRELNLIHQHAARLNVRPRFGVRTRLSARGAGRWKLSTGDRSKFGLTITELLRMLEVLKEQGAEDCLKLLHFHLGSQITNIYNIKGAITEAARIYVELVRAGAGLEYLDVGGGLGIDYDGSQTNFESSVNYSLEEYASDVVFRIKSVCDESDVRHPTIVTESGRALVAYHSVLVVDVLGASRSRLRDMPEDGREEASEVDRETPQCLRELRELHDEVCVKNLLECYHDAVQCYEEAINTFNLGYLTLHERGRAERLYWRALRRIQQIVRTLDHAPEELEGLDDQLCETYFCNFSVFQSLPDSWAIHQLFPIMPIHRLREEPKRRAVLADLTCDSDGKVDRFIDLRGVKRSLELHGLDESHYYLGIFLVGAYQEILGDLHNLFGDTNSAHIELEGAGDDRAESGDLAGHCGVKAIRGDTVEQVLSYVQYSPASLLSGVRRDVEAAARRGQITPAEGERFVRFYRKSLGSSTYLTSRLEEDEVDETARSEAPTRIPAVRSD